MLTARATPAGLGWAVCVGVIIGTSPFFGVQFAITLVVCAILRLNPVITYLAANVSVPPLIPFIIYASIQVGTLVFTGDWLSLDRAAVLAQDPWTFGASWVLGSTVLGLILGIPAGLLTYLLMSLYRRRHPLPPDPVGEAMTRVVQRYRLAGRFAHGYVQGKFRHDPVYRQVAARAPFVAPFVDVGCGRGQTALLLAELQPGIAGLSLDWDDAKVHLAQTLAADLPTLRFERADMRDVELPRAGTIFMLDVLHYHDIETQDSILRRAAAALDPGGTIFIRDVDAAAGWRARATRWQETVGCWLGLNRGRTLVFRPAADLARVLAAQGLTTRIESSWEQTPLANVLIEATKGGAGPRDREEP